MALKILIFLLPALVCGKIKVNIETGRMQADSFVQAIGSSVDIISDTERNTFQINDYQLKNAVEKLSGRMPDGAYVKAPTPHDLYSRYGWNQVQCILKPVSAKVLRLYTKPEIVARKFFRNRSETKNASYTGIVTSQRETTVSTTWTKSYSLSVGQEIEYSVRFGEALSVGGKTSFGFTGSWGSATSKSETLTLGSGLGVEIKLLPGKKAMTVLSASLGVLEVEVEYEATLRGQVSANYAYQLDDHYFWGYDVNAVLRAAGLQTSLRSREIIKVGFYTDEQVINHDL